MWKKTEKTHHLNQRSLQPRIQRPRRTHHIFTPRRTFRRHALPSHIEDYPVSIISQPSPFLLLFIFFSFQIAKERFGNREQKEKERGKTLTMINHPPDIIRRSANSSGRGDEFVSRAGGTGTWV